MTLILTVANSRGVYQSSDYQLIDQNTHAPVSNRAGSKQLDASFKGWNLGLAFTGIAAVGAECTIDHLSATLKTLPPESDLDAVCRSLAKKCKQWCGSRGPLTLVLSVASIGKPFQVVVISNADWGRGPPTARGHFNTQVRTVWKPFHIIEGFRSCVPSRDRALLKALARKMDATQQDIINELAKINSIAAENSNVFVSKECWVTAQFADGEGRCCSAQLNVGSQAGSISGVMIGGFDFAEWVKANLRAKPGEEIRLVQSAGVMTGPRGGVAIPGPEGESRTFSISGLPIEGLLRSPSGRPCTTIGIVPLLSTVIAKRNEAVSVQFAQIRLKAVQSISENFARPKYPWPTLESPISFDGVAVPRGWKYTVGYWIEHGAHHVEIPQSSRSIRKIAFLGDDDELVVVAPAQGCLFNWEPTQNGPTAVVQATVWWRTRLDGTHG